MPSVTPQQPPMPREEPAAPAEVSAMSSMLEEVGLTDRKRMRPVLEEQAVEVVARVLVPMELPPRTVSGRQLRLEEVMAARVPLPAP